MTPVAPIESWAARYRPRRFAGVVGQPQAVRVLTRCLTQGQIFQTVLFQGPTGSGKTSLARIYAAALQCEDPGGRQTGEPCGVCGSCLAVFRHMALDVVEIDGASARGIDTIRALRELATLVPTMPYRVFLIDEAHRLTPAAWEALLAILEDPPARAVFLFATTDASPIPETILSRALVLPLRTIEAADIRTRMADVLRAESHAPVDPVVLDEISRVARGSLRAGIKYLEQLSIADTLTVAGVQSLVGTIDPSLAALLLHGWATGSREDLFPFTEQLSRGGQPKAYLLGMAEAVLAAVVVGHGGDVAPSYGTPGTQQLASVYQEVGEPLLWQWHALLMTELGREGMVPPEHALLALVAQVLFLRDQAPSVTSPPVHRPFTTVPPTPPLPAPAANSVKPAPLAPPPAVHPGDSTVFREFGCD